ncbi:hypothetical protein [Nocardia asteroides]|uniref:hypothetical protein n=1 Tax=Nocardia asteroides TaxID=1824 RepID=UPI001E3BA95B|nr:hypothetical protein [Nocardia asteroides]UGT59870.1 hypothetical protein LTT61_21935 [Nocardia asteroides]
MAASSHRTVLETLIHLPDRRIGSRTVGEWCAFFNHTARAQGESVTLSERQLHRWMAGTTREARPAARRVAAIVWQLDFDTLVSPPTATEPSPALSSVEHLNREIAMSTEDTARWIKSGGGGVDGTVLEQLHADVRRFATDHLTKSPLELIPDLTRARREIFDLLDRRQRPRYLPDLYLIAGQICALLAHACADLGRTYDAETHARTAWFAADYAENSQLRAYVRWVQANIAYWASDYRRAADYADIGLADENDPSTVLRLASQLARSRAAHADTDAALRALDTAMSAIDQVDPAAASGHGVMWFDPGKALYYAAETHLAIGGRRHNEMALTLADSALATFTPDSPAEFSAAAELDAARALLAMGDLDGAAGRLSRVLTLPVELRTTPIIQRVQATAAQVATLAQNARATRDLPERIKLFSTYTAAHS